MTKWILRFSARHSKRKGYVNTSVGLECRWRRNIGEEVRSSAEIMSRLTDL